MALTVTGTQTCEVVNTTLSATPGECTLLVLPGKPGLLLIQARGADAKLVVSAALADGDAIGASAYLTLRADAAYTIDVSGMSGSVFLASATASTVVEVLWSALL